MKTPQQQQREGSPSEASLSSLPPSTVDAAGLLLPSAQSEATAAENAACGQEARRAAVEAQVSVLEKTAFAAKENSLPAPSADVLALPAAAAACVLATPSTGNFDEAKKAQLASVAALTQLGEAGGGGGASTASQTPDSSPLSSSELGSKVLQEHHHHQQQQHSQAIAMETATAQPSAEASLPFLPAPSAASSAPSAASSASSSSSSAASSSSSAAGAVASAAQQRDGGAASLLLREAEISPLRALEALSSAAAFAAVAAAAQNDGKFLLPSSISPPLLGTTAATAALQSPPPPSAPSTEVSAAASSAFALCDLAALNAQVLQAAFASQQQQQQPHPSEAPSEASAAAAQQVISAATNEAESCLPLLSLAAAAGLAATAGSTAAPALLPAVSLAESALQANSAALGEASAATLSGTAADAAAAVSLLVGEGGAEAAPPSLNGAQQQMNPVTTAAAAWRDASVLDTLTDLNSRLSLLLLDATLRQHLDQRLLLRSFASLQETPAAQQQQQQQQPHPPQSAQQQQQTSLAEKGLLASETEAALQASTTEAFLQQHRLALAQLHQTQQQLLLLQQQQPHQALPPTPSLLPQEAADSLLGLSNSLPDVGAAAGAMALQKYLEEYIPAAAASLPAVCTPTAATRGANADCLAKTGSAKTNLSVEEGASAGAPTAAFPPLFPSDEKPLPPVCEALLSAAGTQPQPQPPLAAASLSLEAGPVVAAPAVEDAAFAAAGGVSPAGGPGESSATGASSALASLRSVVSSSRNGRRGGGVEEAASPPLGGVAMGKGLERRHALAGGGSLVAKNLAKAREKGASGGSASAYSRGSTARHKGDPYPHSLMIQLIQPLPTGIKLELKSHKATAKASASAAADAAQSGGMHAPREYALRVSLTRHETKYCSFHSLHGILPAYNEAVRLRNRFAGLPFHLPPLTVADLARRKTLLESGAPLPGHGPQEAFMTVQERTIFYKQGKGAAQLHQQQRFLLQLQQQKQHPQQQQQSKEWPTVSAAAVAASLAPAQGETLASAGEEATNLSTAQPPSASVVTVAHPQQLNPQLPQSSLVCAETSGTNSTELIAAFETLAAAAGSASALPKAAEAEEAASNNNPTPNGNNSTTTAQTPSASRCSTRKRQREVERVSGPASSGAPKNRRVSPQQHSLESEGKNACGSSSCSSPAVGSGLKKAAAFGSGADEASADQGLKGAPGSFNEGGAAADADAVVANNNNPTPQTGESGGSSCWDPTAVAATIAATMGFRLEEFTARLSNFIERAEGRLPKTEESPSAPGGEGGGAAGVEQPGQQASSSWDQPTASAVASEEESLLSDLRGRRCGDGVEDVTRGGEAAPPSSASAARPSSLQSGLGPLPRGCDVGSTAAAR